MATTGNSESRPRPTVFSISALGSGSKEPTTSSAAATGHINVSALGRKRRIGRAVESKLDPESDIAGIVLRIDLGKKGAAEGDEYCNEHFCEDRNALDMRGFWNCSNGLYR